MPNLPLPSAPAVALVALALGATPALAQRGGATAESLESLAAAPVRGQRVTGLVAAVVKGNDTLLMKAYGNADVEWDVPMAVDAMFEVGSIAKQFIAAAILQLRDAGKLSLDDDVTKWLPTLSVRGGSAKLRQMLSHTSGMSIDGPGLSIWDPRPTRDSALSLMRVDRFQFPSGQAQAYNNEAFFLLERVVEKASGMSYQQYVKTKIFDPLRMTRSMYCNSSVNIPRRAHGYSLVNGVVRRAPMVQYSWIGSICSTVPDLMTWLQALHGGKVLSPASYAEMTTPAQLEDGTALQYGFGIKVGENYRGLKYLGHGGTGPGFRADATWYPDAKMAVVVLTNASPAAFDPSDLGGAIAQAILPWPRPKLTYYTEDPAPLVGTYELSVGGNLPGFVVEVTQTPTGLAFAPNGGRPQALPWISGLTFYANESVTLTFRRSNGDTGPVTELRRDDGGNHLILRKR
jgi:CubicO group peptidase (beta-lactamase class C family)